MTESFNAAVRGRLAARTTGLSKKEEKKPADPEELLARAEAALGELRAVIGELAAAEPAEPAEEEEA